MANATLSVGTLYGAAASDFVAAAANIITDIGTLGLSAGGSLVLADTTPLTLDAGSASATTQLTGVTGITLTVTGQTITQGGDTSISSSAGAVMIDAALLTQDPLAAITAATGVSATGAVTQLGQDSITAQTGDYLSGTVQQNGGGMIQALTGSLTVQGSATQIASTLMARQGAVTIDGMLAQSGATLTAGTNATIDAAQSATGTSATELLQSGASMLTAGNDATIYGGATQAASALSAGGAVLIYGSVAQSQAATVSGGMVTIGDAGLAATLSQAGRSAITATNLLAVNLTGGLAQDATSALTSMDGTVSLTSSGGGLSIAGNVTANNGQVFLTTGDGIITQAAPGASATGTIQAASLYAAAGTQDTGSDDLLLNTANANVFATIDRATATGTVNLNDTTNATLAGQALIAGTQAVTLTLGGNTLTQDSLSAIDSQSGTVTISASALTQRNSASISAETGFALTGNLTQLGADSITAATGALAIGGNATQDAQSTLAAQGGNLTIGGSLTQSLSTASAFLNAATGGTIAQTGGTITAGQDVLIGTLAGSGGTTATLLTQSAGSAISAGQTVTVFGATVQDASSITGDAAATILSSLTQSDGAALTGGTVSIGTASLPATLTQDDSIVTATSGNVIAALTGNLAQTATGSIVSQTGSIIIHTSNGTLFLAGQDDASSGLVDLVAANGDITEAAQNSATATGDIQALYLAAQAGTLGGVTHAVLLDTAGGNDIGTLTGIDGTAASGAAGLFVLTDQAALTLATGTTLTGESGVTLTLTPSLQFTQGANSAIASTAAVQILAGTVQQESGADLAGAAGVTISGNLTQLGSNIATSSQGDIAIGGSTAQSASTIQAVTGGVSIGGTLDQVSGMVLAGQTITIGNALYPAGAAGTVLTQSEASLVSAAGNTAIAGGVIQDASSVMSGATLTIDASVAQADQSAIGGASVTIGVSGLAATLSQAASRITASNGQLAISLTGDLTQDSASTLASAAGGISIASTGGGLYLAGTTETPSGAMMLSAPQGTITETAEGATSATGTILAGTLSAQAGSSAAFSLLLNQPGANRIGTITSATATGMLDIADAEDLTLSTAGTIAGDQGAAFSLPGLSFTQDAGSTMTSTAGAVAVNAALLNQANQASIVAASGFSLTGALAQQGGSIDALSGPLTIGGNASQSSGGVIEATAGSIGIGGALVQSDSTASAASAVTVANSVVQTGSSLTAGGIVTLQGGGGLTQSDGSLLSGDQGVALTLAGGLSQDSASAIQSSAANVTIDASSGDIAFAGRLSAAASGAGAFTGTITLIASSGSILGATGTLQTGVLAGSATGNIDLAGAANQIGEIAALAPSIDGLSAGGTLQVNDTGALLVQDSILSGTDGMLLTLTGGLTETSGSTMESLDGRMAIESPAVLRFAGKLAAPQILLGDKQAPKQIIWNGGTILTGSSIPRPGAGMVPSIPDPIGPGNPLYAKGLFATAGNFSQSGTTVIDGLDGAQQETAEFTLKGPGGTIAFDPRTGYGLFAPTTQLLLDVQITGRATGTIDVAGLNLYYFGTTLGAGGGSILTGSVDGRTGTAAAASGFVHSLPGVDYALNNCPIESLSCVLLSPIIVPLGSPVQDIQVSVDRRHQDDDDLILPNVGEQDY